MIYILYLDNLQEIIVAAMEPKSITSCIRCSVHTLQLCVLGGIKSAAISNCIPKAREVILKYLFLILHFHSYLIHKHFIL